MKKAFTFVIILQFGLITFAFSQNKTTFNGFVYSYESKLPIEYANIGVINLPIGTITNKLGEFSLFGEINGNNKINFSCVGFTDVSLSISSLKQNDTIFLKKAIYELNELQIVHKNGVKTKNGSYNENSKVVTGWSNSFANGAERGILIKNKNQKSKINSIHFHVATNSCDSAIVRIHIREIENGTITKEILKQNLIKTISINKGWININVDDYNIIYNKNIVVSIEWLYGNKRCDFSLSGNLFKGILYYKESSDTNWKFKKKFSPSIYIVSTKLF